MMMKYCEFFLFIFLVIINQTINYYNSEQNLLFVTYKNIVLELLRRNAEQCLRDMTQLIFMRLPQFPPEDNATNFTTVGLSLKRRDKSAKKKATASSKIVNFVFFCIYVQ